MQLREKDADLVFGGCLAILGVCYLTVAWERHRSGRAGSLDGITLVICLYVLYAVFVIVRQAVRARGSRSNGQNLDERTVSLMFLGWRMAPISWFVLELAYGGLSDLDLQYLGLAWLLAGVVVAVLSRVRSIPPARGIAD